MSITLTRSLSPSIELRVPREQALQVAALLIYAAIGTFYLGFLRPEGSFWMAALVPVITDAILQRTMDGRVRFTGGPLVSGLSLYLLMECQNPLAYAIAGIISQASKRIFRVDGKQVFNPSNLALIVVIYCFPWLSAAVPGQWRSSPELLLVMAATGLYVSYMADRFWVAVAFLAGFSVICFTRAHVTGAPVIFVAGPCLGAPQILFAFHMVTDPRTSPAPRKQQLLMGAVVGAFDEILRWATIVNAPFIALLFVSSMIPILRPLTDRREKREAA